MSNTTQSCRAYLETNAERFQVDGDMPPTSLMARFWALAPTAPLDYIAVERFDHKGKGVRWELIGVNTEVLVSVIGDTITNPQWSHNNEDSNNPDVFEERNAEAIVTATRRKLSDVVSVEASDGRNWRPYDEYPKDPRWSLRWADGHEAHLPVTRHEPPQADVAAIAAILRNL